jgi:hypothetical protein
MILLGSAGCANAQASSPQKVSFFQQNGFFFVNDVQGLARNLGLEKEELRRL